MVFCISTDDETVSVNRLTPEGEPFDLKWLWPMESVVPENSNLEPGTLGSGRVEKRCLHRDTNGNAILRSWKDAVMFAARSESLGRIAGRISWLAFSVCVAMSVLVLGLAVAVTIATIQRNDALLVSMEAASEGVCRPS